MRRSRFVEALEDRRLLSVTTAYVAHAADFTDTSNPGNQGNPQPGDIVTWNGGANLGTQTGLVFGTSAFTSINAAIAAATDTVEVAPGTYSETIAITKSITLEGANAGIHPTVGTSATAVVGTRVPETVLQLGSYGINPQADNITVDGFKITNIPAGTGNGLIETNSDANNFHLTNTILSDQVNAPTGAAILFGGGSHTGLLADYNVFQDLGDSTFYLGGNSSYEGLQLNYNKFNGAGNGVFYASSSALSNAVVNGNDFDGTIAGTPGVGGPGLNIGTGGNITIESNSFHDLNTTAFQVGIDGGSVVGNTFQNIYPYGGGFSGSAMQLWGGEYGTTVSTNVSITNNIIHYNDQTDGSNDPVHGIRLRGPDTPPNGSIDGSTIHINDNDFINGGAVASGAYAILNQGDSTKTVDASANWWGTNVAADIAGMFSGSPVDFTPYLNSGNNSATGIGFQGDFSLLNVTSLGGQVGTTGRIQEADNLATIGGTINVGPGTYNENLIVDKQLTIVGAGSGNNPASDTIIDAGGSGAGARIAASGASAAIADRLTIRNLRVQNGADGVIIDSAVSHITLDNIAAVGNTYGIEIHNNAVVNDLLLNNVTATGNQVGFRVATTGSVNGLMITNGHFDNNTSIGFYTNGNSGSTTNQNDFTNISISNTTFNNNTLKGIYAEKLDHATFDAITVDQSGTSGASSAGIDINLKYGNYSDITIKNSSITNSGTGDTTAGVGVTFKARADGGYAANPATLTGVTLTNNVISGNQNGIRAGESDDLTNNPTQVVIRYNDLSGNLGVALDNQTPNVIDASRNWWGNLSGPTIASNVGGTGATILETSGAVTYAPWLIYGTNAAPAGTPGFQLPTIVPVTSQGDVSPAVNDFTLLQNAIGAAATGQTIDLSGPFDWTETNAAAAYNASTNTAPTADIRGAALPDGVNNLTITSSAQNATITGLGDSTDAVYNSFVFSAVDSSSPTDVGNNNLTISNLTLDNFKSGIMLGWNGEGTFNGTLVKNNTITVAADNDNNAGDVQGIAVYFTAGQNQTMTGNTIEFMGNGTRTTGSGARSFGFQNSTTGGTGYNGLSIDHNIFKLLPSAVGGAEVVTGIWENGHNDDNNSHISIADNQFLGIQGQRKFDIALQLSSQTTNMAIDGNTFTDVKYVYWVGAHNGDVSGDQFTFTNNTLTRVGDANGVFLQNVASDAVPPYTITINWGTNNTIDGFTGIRGLNELSTQATGTSRPNGAATDLNAVVAFGPIQVDYVNASWGAQGRFTNPLAAPDGTPGPIAFGFNTFNTIQAGVDGINTTPGTVNVLPGTYAENVTIDKNLTLAGTGAAPSDVVVAPAAGDGITIAAPATDVTVKNLEVTGATGNGISANGVATVSLNNLLLDGNNVGFAASGLTTLNLSDLTLTGNASAGGTIAGVTTVNDTPVTGSTGATDTITGSTIQRGSDDVVNYIGVSNLNITGSAGADTFNVTPATSTAISINGGLPTPPTTPGDTLNVDTSGAATPALNYVSAPAGFQGSFTFGDRDAVSFQGIESLTGVANLTITKIDNSATPGLAVPGAPLTYTIVVTNNGPSAANGAVVTDNLPAGFNATGYTSVASAGVVDTNPTGSGNINDTITTLPVGGSITYTVTGNVGSAATGTLTNSATASLTSPIPQTVTATDVATLTPQADLSITKTDNSPTPGQVLAGSPLTYTIVVTNNGPSDATAGVVDTLPAYFTGGSYTATATGGAIGYTASGNGNISDFVSLPAGSTITYVVTGTVSAAATGNLSNTATVVALSGVVDTNPSNNHATDTNVVSTQTDLSITKTDNSVTPGTVVPGASLTYTIVVTNSGAAVTGAKVTDALPTDFTAASYTAVATGGATGYTASGNGDINDTVNLPAGATITYTVTGTVKSSATGSLSNTAKVTAPANIIDTNPANNSATDISALAAQTHVSITKSDDKGGDSTTNTAGSVVAGTAMTYTIVVSNSGPSDATGVKVADLFAAGFTNATYTATATGGATGFTANGSGDINDSLVNLPAGSSVIYVVTGTVASSATGTLSNTANVTLPPGLTNTGATSATDNDTITSQPNLSITKSDNKGGDSATNAIGSVAAGTPLTYTIVVSNAGPSDVTGATFVDNFPAGFTVTSANHVLVGGASITTSTGTGGNLADTVNLPAGGSIVYVVSGTVGASASGILSNSAKVTSGATSVTATDTDSITSQANLSITKSDNKGGDSATSTVGSVVAGTPLTYTIVVSNAGPSDVTGATVADTLPAGFTFTSAIHTLVGGASITASTGTGGDIADTVNLPAGGSIVYVVSGTVSASASGTLSNSAKITSGANTVTATDTDTITGQVNLSITKKDNKGGDSATSTTGSVIAGGALTYTIVVTNSGPSDLTGATISDLFPADFTGVTYTATATGGASGFTANGSGNINDTVNIPVGVSITYVISGTVAPSASGTLSNTVNVTAPAGVNNSGDTSATDTDTITAVAPTGVGYLAGTPGDGTAQTFVQNLYRELLGREPDATGEAFWVAKVQADSSAAGRQAVVASFMNSQEYKDHYITTLYEVFLGRAPEAGALEYWSGQMGSPGTAGAHSGSADEKIIVSQIVGSDEFYAHAGGTDQSFAQALYQDLLGRTGDSLGVTFWSNLAHAQPQHRDAIVRLFLTSPEAAHKLLDSFYPAPGGTAANPLPAPGTGVPASSYDLAVVTGLGWENLYLQGPFDNTPEGNDAFFADLASGTGWDDVQFDLLTSDQFYNNPNRPVTT